MANQTKKETKKKPQKKKVIKSKKKVDKAVKSKKSSETELSGGKQDIIRQFALKEGDTGSPEVQVAISTQKIMNLTSHLDQNPKDNHSRRGLLKIVAKRRRILNYLQSKGEDRYKELIKKLNLKK